MTHHLCAILVTFGLLIAFLTYALRWVKISICLPFAIAGVGFLTFCSISMFILVIEGGSFYYYMGGWPPPIGIAYHVDALNSFTCLLVCLVALLNLITNWDAFEEKVKDKIGGTMALYILFITGLNGILLTADLFNLYVLLEIASLTGYALLAIGDERRAPFASLSYVFLGTIGACFYLLGVGYLYIKTGSLNMQDVSILIKPMYGSATILAGFVFIMLGVWVKMALFPLHIWLPRAYTYAFGPISSLIAPLATKVMAYIMLRIVLFVFGWDFSFGLLKLQKVLTILSVLAILYGALFALRQSNLRRMLCFVIITEIGYLASGFGVGNAIGLKGSTLHLLNDMVMTFCLFLSLDGIIRREGEKLTDLPGFFKKSPFQSSVYVLAALSVIGIPPTPGFFGKWYLLEGSLKASNFWIFGAILISSLMNAVLFFRTFEIGYFEDLHRTSLREARQWQWSQHTGLLISALLLLGMGLLANQIVINIVEPFLRSAKIL